MDEPRSLADVGDGIDSVDAALVELLARRHGLLRRARSRQCGSASKAHCSDRLEEAV
jgi:chorismate mutase